MAKQWTRRDVLKAGGALAAGAAVVGAGFALPGCGDDDNGGGEPTGSGGGGGKQTLVIGAPDTPPGIDREFHVNLLSYECVANTSAFLVDFPFKKNPDDDRFMVPDFNQIQGGLVEKWDESEDHATYTLHLRKGVKSAAGNEFTADDVRWTWDRAFDLQALGTFFAGVAKIPDADAFKVVDPYTVEYTVSEPNILALPVHAITMNPILDSKAAQAHASADDKWAKNWIAQNGAGWGAYAVQDWRAGDSVTFVANPSYYRGAPKISEIIYKAIPSTANRLSLLKSGELDIAEWLLPRESNELKNDPNINVFAYRGNLTVRAEMNNTRQPFSDVRVRQALNYACPRDDIVNTAYFGFALPMKSSIPSIFPGYTEEYWPYDTNLDKAKQLLAAAGYEDGFSTTLYYDAFLPVHEDVATIMRTEYGKIGVDLTLQKLPAATFAERLQNSDMDFYLHEEMPVYPNVHYAHFLFYTSDSFVNYSKYSNEDVDRLTLKGLSTFETDEQLNIGKEVQKILMDDPPAVFVVFPGHQLSARKTVGDYRWYGTDHATWQYLTA